MITPNILLNYPNVINTTISPMALNPISAPLYTLNDIVFKTPITYPNVNNDPNLRKKMVKYYWHKIDYWLNNSSLYRKLYNNMYVVDDKVKFGVDNKPENTRNNLFKYEYIIKEIINKKDLYDILDKFCKINNVNYWDLQELHVKDKVKKFIYSKIKNVIHNQKN